MFELAAVYWLSSVKLLLLLTVYSSALNEVLSFCTTQNFLDALGQIVSIFSKFCKFLLWVNVLTVDFL